MVCVFVSNFIKASYGDTPNGINTATMLYFLLAAGVEVVCIVLYFVLLCTNFARYHMAKATSGNSSKMDDETESLLAGGTGKDGVPKQVIFSNKNLLLFF